MAEIPLAVQTGRPTGSRAARRLRREGLVPGIVYGHGAEPLPVAVAARDLRAALTTDLGVNALLSLQAGDKTILAMARAVQRHPVKGVVTHVDFQTVRRDEVIAAEVPITLVGEATEVLHGQGHVDQQLFTLTVRARPSDIPSSIDVDISRLGVGETIRVGDLELPPGAATDVDVDTPVATGQPPRAEAAAAEAGAEGEAATPAPEERAEAADQTVAAAEE